MSYDMLSNFSGVSKGSVKTTCTRLRDANLIGLHSVGGGRGAVTGFEVYSQTIQVYSRIKALNKINHFNNETEHNYTQLHTTLHTNASSKLVSNYNNNLLTKAKTAITQTPEVEETTSFSVEEIRIDHLSKFSITRKQIQDIKNQKLAFTTMDLQDFVDRFGIYASEPKNIRNVNSLPGVFVKMAQLAAKGEDPLAGIETESDRLMREHLSHLKSKMEMRDQQKQELIELEFENWLSEIQQTGMDEIVPPNNNLMKSGSIAQKMSLKEYFMASVWPSRKDSLGFDL